MVLVKITTWWLNSFDVSLDLLQRSHLYPGAGMLLRRLGYIFIHPTGKVLLTLDLLHCLNLLLVHREVFLVQSLRLGLVVPLFRQGEVVTFKHLLNSA